ncbi:hypothetical protein BT93_B2120 [Corymbia citriodora subsp. variegata]|nr:hypothetical protein BT93_B2120 [Corymbia citriodora subsp. variegata]
MTETKSRERAGSSKTPPSKKSKADAPAVKSKQEPPRPPKAGKSNGVAPPPGPPEVLVVPSSSTESQAREPESTRSRSPKARERGADPAGAKKRRHRKREEGGASEEGRRSSKSNGAAREPEVLVVPSSSTESQGGGGGGGGGEREPKLREERVAGSAAVQKKRKHQEREDGDESRDDSKLCIFPMNRIRTIAKSEESDLRINHEAYFVINKASEKFIEQLCEDAYAVTAARDRKRSFKYQHLSSLVCKWKRYDFLSDFVPEKMKAEDALAERKPEET